MKTKLDNDNLRGWWVILIPLTVLIATLICVIRFFKADALNGASQIALIMASGVTVALALIVFRTGWEKIETAITDNIKTIGSSVMILLFVGAISGTWMVSGVVPTMMCYGLQVMTPGLFLFVTCVICALVSLVTGSSWTTIATIGVAFIGIGSALGYSGGWTAGAIISGAYFGDKISPLSDTTVVASSCAQTPLFTHIRYMLITTIPSMAIACIIFLVASLLHPNVDATHSVGFVDSLKASFNISPWLLLVPVAVAVLIAKRVPALLTLFLASLLAATVSFFSQPDIVAAIGGKQALDFESGFRGFMITFFGDTSVATGNESLDQLVQTHGMKGMLNTIFLILCAATFGGCLTGSGMIQKLTEKLSQNLNRRGSIVASAVTTGIVSNMLTGDQYLSIILTVNLYKRLFHKKGFEPRLLSRSAEDSATVTSVLIPWNTCGMTQSTVLKVPTLEYFPYCFFNLISPLMSIFIASIGYKIVKKENF